MRSFVIGYCFFSSDLLPELFLLKQKSPRLSPKALRGFFIAKKLFSHSSENKSKKACMLQLSAVSL